jgi:hypothetical protein
MQSSVKTADATAVSFKQKSLPILYSTAGNSPEEKARVERENK